MEILSEIRQRVEKLTAEQQEELLLILQAWQQDKKREFRRLQVTSQVDVASEHRMVQTNMRDVSASGIYIDTPKKFKLNEKVKVVFTIPGYEKPFKLTGVIVRVEQHGFAIKFEEVTTYFKKILDDVIGKNLP